MAGFSVSSLIKEEPQGLAVDARGTLVAFDPSPRLQQITTPTNRISQAVRNRAACFEVVSPRSPGACCTALRRLPRRDMGDCCTASPAHVFSRGMIAE